MFPERGAIYVGGHRGAPLEAPENTMASLRRAIDHGVDFIEVDVQLSKHGVPFLMHDATLGRTTNADAQLRIADLTSRELHKLDAGSWHSPSFAGERVPTLQEALEQCLGQTRFMLELKSSSTESLKLVGIVCDLVRQVKGDHRVVFSSFEPEIVDHLLERLPRNQVMGIAEEQAQLEQWERRKLDHLVVHDTLLSKCLESGTQAHLWVWTVNDPQHAAHLQTLGVAGIITDDPAAIIAWTESGQCW